jgi:small-conductance mechanosensitive channel
VLHEIAQRLTALLTADRTEALIRAAAILVVGMLVARWVGRAIGRLVRRGDPQRAILAKRLSGGGLLLLALAWALQELGFQLGVLLGAAGVATVAIGFASQTSLSNVISGFFLFGERPFKIGDVIEVYGVTGEMLAAHMISTKLRYLLLKTSLSEDIRQTFEERGLERPYSHQVVHDAGGKP